MSLNKINLSKWIEKGNIIPTCINEGCENSVAIRHWSAQGDPSLKTECSRCAVARKKNKNIDGITFHKKNFCENIDGILGFICPMIKERYSEFPSDIYHMDHLDGNHHNNSLDNLKTLSHKLIPALLETPLTLIPTKNICHLRLFHCCLFCFSIFLEIQM